MASFGATEYDRRTEFFRKEVLLMSNPMPHSPVYGSTLKWIAILTMLCDHIAAVVLMPLYGVVVDFTSLSSLAAAFASGGITTLCSLLRLIGRLAFPIFCFLLAEGLHYTHSRVRYLRNILIAGLLSEVPFDLCLRSTPFALDTQNVMWTLALGLIACTLLDRLHNRRWLGLLAALGCAAVAYITHTDYDAFGVVLIVLLYLLRQERLPQCLVGAFMTAFEYSAPLAFVPIYCYNGRRGRQMKWFFYLFYPVHLFLLYLIRYSLAGF